MGRNENHTPKVYNGDNFSNNDTVSVSWIDRPKHMRTVHNVPSMDDSVPQTTGNDESLWTPGHLLKLDLHERKIY